MLPEEKVKALGENVTELFKYVDGVLGTCQLARLLAGSTTIMK